ncbi:VOC family protein [Rhizobacter sp. AJA081-3]|uniref:VOC family protein n=1 Tax=Rhizobacter sp. AJA081-3 TaxID=2753607 RepID=UPI001AE07165|nr:VOC family protein [Rhizobacter sp. AJA081-3]QTN21476.1 VOC family protein [Rhizobacter sp. AJA081-3]
MAVHLDHLMIPSKSSEAAARTLAEILGVTWAPAKVGPFIAVHVNDSLTIDFDEWTDEFPKGHYCFRVSELEFQVILARLVASGIAYRSLPHGPNDYQVNTSLGSLIVYWDEPDGHVWELLTQSYARDSGKQTGQTQSAA